MQLGARRLPVPCDSVFAQVLHFFRHALEKQREALDSKAEQGLVRSLFALLGGLLPCSAKEPRDALSVQKRLNDVALNFELGVYAKANNNRACQIAKARCLDATGSPVMASSCKRLSHWLLLP